MTTESAVSVTEVRVLEGPNLYFAKPAIKVSLELPDVQSGNIVSSTQVANAKIEYRANGAIDSAQVMGWLSRFFMSFLPF